MIQEQSVTGSGNVCFWVRGSEKFSESLVRKKKKKKKKQKPSLTGSVISVTNREAHQCLKMGFSVNPRDVDPGDVGEVQT